MRSRSVMPGAKHSTHGMGFGPNLTPMVDVVMVILIFFMAAAAFLGPEWFLQATLPAPAIAPDQADLVGDDTEPIVLPTLQLRVEIRVESGQTVAGLAGGTLKPLGVFLEEFRGAATGMLEADATQSVTIAPADDVSWEDVIRAHEVMSEAGFARVRLE